MECKSCGAQISDSENQCPYCQAVIRGRAAAPVVFAQPKKTSGNKTFKVFSNGRQTFAVKQGWSWPGFFFSWIWAFTKSLHVAGALALVVFIIAGALNSGKSDPTPGDTACSLVCLVLIIFFGAKGNQWWENRLSKNGYALRGEVKASNPTDAISQFP